MSLGDVVGAAMVAFQSEDDSPFGTVRRWRIGQTDFVMIGDDPYTVIGIDQWPRFGSAVWCATCDLEHGPGEEIRNLAPWILEGIVDDWRAAA